MWTALGTGLSGMAPGSVQGLQIVVPDVEAARDELLQRGVEVSEVQKFDWGSFVFFKRPGRQRLGVAAAPRAGLGRRLTSPAWRRS
jgi:hypothetical protein